jgi:hypothetical protein
MGTMSPEDTAAQRGRAVIAQLLEAGRLRGLEPVTEYPVAGGRVDVVWLWSPSPPIPGVTQSLPVAGFEVESSWRTRKHLKGDYVNLADLAASLAVIVLLGDDPEVEATRRFAEAFTARPGSRVLIWSADDVAALVEPLGEARLSSGAPVDERATAERHAGKYGTLWAWLVAHEDDEIAVNFRTIEEVIGMPLPPSSRRHLAHWSGYEGSAVARAIRDAGYRATNLDLTNESVTFRGQQEDKP